MTLAECQHAAGVRGFGRRWLGTSDEATEAAGCVLWEENGNVEFNRNVRHEQCNVRGTCLCQGTNGAEVLLIGTPPET